MSPNEIKQQLQETPPLRTILRGKLWKFLQNEVEEVPEGSLFDYPRFTCFRCQEQDMFLYQSPYSEPGALWCLPCIVRSFFNPDVERYSPYAETEVQGVYCWILSEEELPDEDDWD